MIVLQAAGVSKSLAGRLILDNINMTLQEGDKAGLVGINGSGKTTLLKCLTGHLEPDRGSVTVSRYQTIGLLEQLPQRRPEDTVWEAMMASFSDLLDIRRRLTLLEHALSSGQSDVELLLKQYSLLQDEYHERNGYASETMARRILAGLGINPCQYELRLRSLSGGQKTRLDLARLLAGRPSILLLDEPTNHLDINAVEWLEDYLEDYSGTVLVVSHDRRFLDRMVKRVFELREHKLRSFEGNYSAFVAKAQAEDQARLKAFEKQQEQIRHTQAYIERYRSGIKAKQARGRQSQLDRMERVERPAEEIRRQDWRLRARQSSGEIVVDLHEVGKSYADKTLFTGLNLLIRRGERVALLGPNGCGKTTLLKLISLQVTPDAGAIKLGSGVKVGYFSQGCEDLSPQRTLLDEMIYGCGLNVQQARDKLSMMHFCAATVERKVSELSGGEKGRLAILKLLCSGANLLLLDEPTNHLDIFAREALEKMLQGYDGTILAVSHDRYFIDQVACRTLAFQEGILVDYPGNYSYYREKIFAPVVKTNPCVAADASSQQQFRMQQKEQERDKRRLERRLQELEEAIKSLESLEQELSEILSNPKIYQDQAEAATYVKQLENTQNQLLTSYQEWNEALEYWKMHYNNGGDGNR